MESGIEIVTGIVLLVMGLSFLLNDLVESRYGVPGSDFSGVLLIIIEVFVGEYSILVSD